MWLEVLLLPYPIFLKHTLEALLIFETEPEQDKQEYNKQHVTPLAQGYSKNDYIYYW